jgi:polyketide cyclase/dehydrase/lipid transport protein
MRIVLIVVGVLVLLVVGVVVIGAMLPKRHVAERRATFKASPEKLFALIAGSQDWRPDVNSCELITGDGGKQFPREISKRGQTVLYELQGSKPPLAIQRRIATENLPYGGTWSFALEPANGETVVRITEDGEVYNPIFRFVSKFVMGQTAMQDAYLKAMGKAVGEDVRIGS